MHSLQMSKLKLFFITSNLLTITRSVIYSNSFGKTLIKPNCKVYELLDISDNIIFIECYEHQLNVPVDIYKY